MALTTDTKADRHTEALALVESLDTAEPDTLVSVGSVVDGLLDLHNLLDGPDRMVVDALLRAVPGVNVVESNWWIQQLDALRLLLADEPE